jgi:hypothetical protein
MIKMVTLLKRKPGMSMDEFINYYETKHSKIGEKYLASHAVRYFRRYLRPLPESIIPTPMEQYYDVVMEIWFPDLSALSATFEVLMKPEVQKEIIEDESKLFDRSKIHVYLVEEHESKLTGSE